MKKFLVGIIIGVLSFSQVAFSSEMSEETRIPIIGEEAPAFTAKTTQGVINFPQDYQGSWVILFSQYVSLKGVNKLTHGYGREPAYFGEGAKNWDFPFFEKWDCDFIHETLRLGSDTVDEYTQE